MRLRRTTRCLPTFARALVPASLSALQGRLASIVEERRKLERQLTDAKRELALRPESAAGADGSPVREIGDTKLLARVVYGVSPKDLRGLVDEAKQQIGSGIVAVVGVSDEGKAGLVVGVTGDLTSSHSAVDLVRIGAGILGGKGGGGRPDLAQAGGPDGAKADEVLEAIAARLGSSSESQQPVSAAGGGGSAESRGLALSAVLPRDYARTLEGDRLCGRDIPRYGRTHVLIDLVDKSFG